MAESEAQRAAREANLRKGNPAAYGGARPGRSQGDAQGDAEPGPGSAQGDSPTRRTYRATTKGAKTPKQRRTPPRATPRANGAGAQGDAQGGPGSSQGGGGFLGGLMAALRG